MLKKILSQIVIVCFFLTTLGPLPKAHADSVLGLPAPGTMVNLSPAYDPVMIKGLTVHKDNPFLFDFIVDVGQDRMSGGPLKKEGEKLIKYFLAGLAIPDKDVWVNLSPYEKNRMIPEVLSQTDMGRDLLEQDYILKQITASLIYPEKQLGRIFWDKIYAKAQEMYGTSQIPVNTFNKVWIMADRAEVFEHNQTAFVVDSHLKVMLEEDYLALNHHANSPVILSEAKDLNKINSIRDSSAAPQNDTHLLASQIVRQIILPELEKEVNTGKNFANLRQIFNSIILSSWYKRNLKEALLNQVYANKSEVKGIERPVILSPKGEESQQNLSPEQIYQQYLKAYKKGVFNYIKEDVNASGVRIPRKYFSGGITQLGNVSLAMTSDPSSLREISSEEQEGRLKNFATFASLRQVNPNTANTNAEQKKLEQITWGLGLSSLASVTGLSSIARMFLNYYPDYSNWHIAASFVVSAAGFAGVLASFNALLNREERLKRTADFRLSIREYSQNPRSQEVFTRTILSLRDLANALKKQSFKRDKAEEYIIAQLKDVVKNEKLPNYIFYDLQPRARQVIGMVYKPNAAMTVQPMVLFKHMPADGLHKRTLPFHQVQDGIKYLLKKITSIKRNNAERTTIISFEKEFLYLTDVLYALQSELQPAFDFKEENQPGDLHQWSILSNIGYLDGVDYFRITLEGFQKNLDSQMKELINKASSAVKPRNPQEEKLAAIKTADFVDEHVELSAAMKTRIKNAFERRGIITLLDLVQKTMGEMELINQIGVKSLRELNRALKNQGLSFGMRFDQAMLILADKTMPDAAMAAERPRKVTQKVVIYDNGRPILGEILNYQLHNGRYYYAVEKLEGPEKYKLAVAVDEGQVYDRAMYFNTGSITVKSPGGLRKIDRLFRKIVLVHGLPKENSSESINDGALKLSMEVPIKGVLIFKIEMNLRPVFIGNKKKLALLRDDETNTLVASSLLQPTDDNALQVNFLDIKDRSGNYRLALIDEKGELISGEALKQENPGNISNAAMTAKGDSSEINIASGNKDDINLAMAAKKARKNGDMVRVFVDDKLISGKVLSHETYDGRRYYSILLLEGPLKNKTASAVDDRDVLDPAMTNGLGAKNPGGIDLNTSNGMQWKVTKEGRGVEMAVDPALIERIRHIGIDSLSPVIFRITPVTNIWSLAGLEAPMK